jgi:hypothetical protein
MKFMQEEKLVL